MKVVVFEQHKIDGGKEFVYVYLLIACPIVQHYELGCRMKRTLKKKKEKEGNNIVT